MQTRCLTAVDLAENGAIQIQYRPLAVKATSDADLEGRLFLRQCRRIAQNNVLRLHYHIRIIEFVPQ